MGGRVGVSLESERPWQADLCQFFTRDKVAELCLRQVAFPKNLLSMKLLEPAAGQGAFFLPLVPRLVRSCRQQKESFDSLLPVIRAFEIDGQVATELRVQTATMLERFGVERAKTRSETRGRKYSQRKSDPM
jgi:adenine-specific DNA-methyltransferase